MAKSNKENIASSHIGTLFSGRLTRWRSKDFRPTRLANDPGRRIMGFSLTPNFIYALTYNVQYSSCVEILSSALKSHWLDSLDMRSDKHWEILINLFHTGVEREIVTSYFLKLKTKTPSKYIASFIREVSDTSIRPSLVADLVHMGFPEILESVHQLESSDEVLFYMNQLSKNSLPKILENYGVATVEKLILLCGYETTGPTNVIPEDPPCFRTPTSLWLWYCNFIDSHDLKWASKWKQVDSKRLEAIWQLFGLANSVKFLEKSTFSYGGDTACTSENNTLSSRRLLVWKNSESLFLLNYNGQYRLADDLMQQLKDEAENINKIYGKSLQASTVAFRLKHYTDKLNYATKLVPLEVLTSSTEKEKYLSQIGADLSILDPIKAVELNAAHFSTIVFPMCYLSDTEIRLALILILLETLGQTEQVQVQFAPLEIIRSTNNVEGLGNLQLSETKCLAVVKIAPQEEQRK